MKEPDWIKWEGGECPVPEGTLVDVQHRDGEKFCGVPARTSYAEDWKDDNSPYDIVAYRPHLEVHNG